jgi:hypothetical protein
LIDVCGNAIVLAFIAMYGHLRPVLAAAQYPKKPGWIKHEHSYLYAGVLLEIYCNRVKNSGANITT